MKRRVLYIVAVLLLLATLYGLKEYFRTHKDLTGELPVAQLNINALIDAFESDSAGSSRLYINKVIAVNGRIKNVQAGDNPVVITLGEEDQMSSVQCSMDSTHVAAYSSLAIGDAVNIKGICTGAVSHDLFGTDVKLSRCLIYEK